MAAAACNHDAFDRPLADQAGLAFSPVDAMLQLKKSFFAVRIHVIRNGGAAQGNGFLENFLDCSMKFAELLPVDGCGAAARADPGTKQGLISVYVSHTAQ